MLDYKELGKKVDAVIESIEVDDVQEWLLRRSSKVIADINDVMPSEFEINGTDEEVYSVEFESDGGVNKETFEDELYTYYRSAA